MATIIVANLFNPLATLYGQQITKIQWNAPYSILLLCNDWYWKQFDTEMLWYANWHGTSFFPAPQIEFCNLLCCFLKYFVRMRHFGGNGHPSTNILTATLLYEYIKYFHWIQLYNEYFERNFFQYYFYHGNIEINLS